ncbi:FAD/NAD(P)-binding domain-containing protein [Nemania diffusa]|nr:FAD/NAD(P)-binding domain-containing protein [Nemania diffusa]
MSSQQTGPPPIAIVGGGPCGLTLARLLELARVPYVVFERDASGAPASHHQGGSLDLHAETGQAALAAAGLTAEFERHARREAEVLTVVDSQGNNRFRIGGAHKPGMDRPEIDRSKLRDILLASLPEGRVRWGKALRGVEKDEEGEGGWRLRFADGESEAGFRLVVGADGAWSKVRPVLTSAKPIYSGKFYIEGRLSHSNPQYAAAQDLAGPGLSPAIGAGRLLVVQQMGDRTYRVYAGLAEPESLTKPGAPLDFTSPGADADAARAALLGYFAGWAPSLRALIENAEGPWRVWPLYTFEPAVFAPEAEEGAWRRVPGVTLVGDAAHVTLPNGEGVNLAMLDAMKLFESLSAELGFKAGGEERGVVDFDPKADAAAVERAVVAYETEMHKRALEHVKDGIMMNTMMYQADGAERMIAMFKEFEQQGAGQS